MKVYTALRLADGLSSRMLDALHVWASNPQGSTARTNNGRGGGTHGAMVRRGLVGLGVDENGRAGYFLTPKAWAFLAAQYRTVRPADAGRLTLDQALAEAYPEIPAAAPRSGEVVIPGALADYLAEQRINDDETRDALDAAHRGRGRTLIIEPTSTRPLHVISAYADAILENRSLHTPAKIRAARLWIQRAGHAPVQVSEQSVADIVTAVLASGPHRPHIMRRIHTPQLAEAVAMWAYGISSDEIAADWEQVRAALFAIEESEQASVATEAQQAAAVVTDAEASIGTWRGEWIGEQDHDDALFPVDRPADQGALFAPTVREPIVARASFRPDDLARIKTKAAADREAYRAETDDKIAAECAAHGVAPSQAVADRIAVRAAAQAPERRVVEGVVVAHSGMTLGTAPKHAEDPDARAALAALAPLRLAEVSDHTDYAAEPGDDGHKPDAWGFLAEPRGNGRVALYWLEAGRYVRTDGAPFAVELEIGAEKLRKAGWRIEPHTRRCVMAWRPE
ncbi:hypothetical protein [Streptomyces sp. x-80]|uniref:hypothetical protein n=1 Tax=Streptomyces sp. x-80 TaxID=2789282 RepID=UPI00397F8C75